MPRASTPAVDPLGAFSALAIGDAAPEPRAADAPSAAAADALDEGFRPLYDAHFDYVFHSLRRLGVPDADLEDLCHDVFVAFWRGRAEFDRSRPLKPWLFGIAFRVASDFRRRARHRFESPAGDDEPRDPAPDVEARVAASQERALVRRALAAMDLEKRAVLILHDLDGHTMPEIAAALGVPLNTCYSRLRLGRAQFAAAVERLRLAASPKPAK